jgi:lambda family phage portal protein
VTFSNPLDSFISFVSPKWALHRALARKSLSLALGGYTSVDPARRVMRNWRPTRGDADADINPALASLREASRDLVRNEPLAGAVLAVKTGCVIGPGLQCRASIDADFLGLTENDADKWEDRVEREFELWSMSTRCDTSRCLNFYGLQDLVFRSSLENGDVFVLLTNSDVADPYTLSLQLVEADRVCNPDGVMDGPTLSSGVEKDEMSGDPVAYHIARFHPGAQRYGLSRVWDRVAAFAADGMPNVLHIYRALRVGQTRGVPDLAPVIELIHTLGNYRANEVEAAAISSAFTAFIKTPSGDGLASFASGSSNSGTPTGEYRMASGAILDLAPGEDVQFANPSRPNTAFAAFVTAVSEEIGSRLELPYEVLRMHFTASYSASRAALLQAWLFFRARRAWFASVFCQPVYEAWLTEAVALGRISAPGFFQDSAIRAAYCRADWIGPSMGALNPENEVNAAAVMEDRGWKTASENTAELTGGDWERKHRQRAKEQAWRVADGLAVPLNKVTK